jgi:hypothetical protein
MNLIDDQFNPHAIVRLLDTKRLTFDQVAPEMRDEVLLLSAETGHGFHEIPRSFHTPQVDALATQCLCKYFGWGDQHGGYYQAATKFISEGIGLNYVHPDYIDSALLLINLSSGGDSLQDFVRRIFRKYHDKVDNNLLNFIGSRDISLLDDFIRSGFDVKPLSAEHLSEGLISQLWAGYLLVEYGRLDVLSLAIKAGHWPDRKTEVRIDKPKSLKDAIEARMLTKEFESVQAGWLNAFIANYPAAEVAPHMNTRARRAVLMDIFPEEELHAIALHDRALRGDLLERSMGL